MKKFKYPIFILLLSVSGYGFSGITVVSVKYTEYELTEEHISATAKDGLERKGIENQRVNTVYLERSPKICNPSKNGSKNLSKSIF